MLSHQITDRSHSDLSLMSSQVGDSLSPSSFAFQYNDYESRCLEVKSLKKGLIFDSSNISETIKSFEKKLGHQKGKKINLLVLRRETSTTLNSNRQTPIIFGGNANSSDRNLRLHAESETPAQKSTFKYESHEQVPTSSGYCCQKVLSFSKDSNVRINTNQRSGNSIQAVEKFKISKNQNRKSSLAEFSISFGNSDFSKNKMQYHLNEQETLEKGGYQKILPDDIMNSESLWSLSQIQSLEMSTIGADTSQPFSSQFPEARQQFTLE